MASAAHQVSVSRRHHQDYTHGDGGKKVGRQRGRRHSETQGAAAAAVAGAAAAGKIATQMLSLAGHESGRGVRRVVSEATVSQAFDDVATRVARLKLWRGADSIGRGASSDSIAEAPRKRSPDQNFLERILHSLSSGKSLSDEMLEELSEVDFSDCRQDTIEEYVDALRVLIENDSSTDKEKEIVRKAIKSFIKSAVGFDDDTGSRSDEGEDIAILHFELKTLLKVLRLLNADDTLELSSQDEQALQTIMACLARKGFSDLYLITLSDFMPVLLFLGKSKCTEAASLFEKLIEWMATNYSDVFKDKLDALLCYNTMKVLIGRIKEPKVKEVVALLILEIKCNHRPIPAVYKDDFAKMLRTLKPSYPNRYPDADTHRYIDEALFTMDRSIRH